MSLSQWLSQAVVVITVAAGVSCSTYRSAGLPSAQGTVVDTGTVVSGGYGLRYTIEGSGPPALVVGSAQTGARIFSANLRSHLRLVFVDHRGFARSPGRRDTTAFALDTLLADMERVRQHLQLGRVLVVGHSGHSYLALEYAKRYPASVSHVVMVGISPNLSAANARVAARYWDSTATVERKAAMQVNLRRFPDSVLAKLPPGQRFIQAYVRDGPRYWYDPHFDSSPLWDGVDIDMVMFNYVWGRVFRDIDVTRGLDSLDCPVFLAVGRYDYVIGPPTSWERVRGSFKNLTLRVFEKSGHTPQFEEAALFDRELLAWLGRS